MREKFRSIWDLAAYYQFLKFDVISCPTILPPQNSNFGDKMSFINNKSAREEKMCFIGDVEKFAMVYYTSQSCHSAITNKCSICHDDKPCESRRSRATLFPIPYACINEIFAFTFAPFVWLVDVFPEKSINIARKGFNKDEYETSWQQFKATHHTLTQLARVFKRRIKRGEKIPYRLKYRSHLSDIRKDLIVKAEVYFKGIGFITT